jgi:hypothetical protein
MILDQAIKEVQQICGWRSDKVAEITAALQYSQTEREKSNRTYPWFLRKQNDTAIVTSYNVPKYPIPTDYIEDTEEKDGNLFIFLQSSPGASGGAAPQPPGYSVSRTIFLKKQSFEPAQVRYYGEWPYVYYNAAGVIYDIGSTIGPGVPIDYYLGADSVTLYPAPDGVYNISWRYWAQDAPQALGQANKWLTNAPWCLIADAAIKIGMDLGNGQAVQTAQAVGAKAEDNLFRATINRSEAGRRRSMGSRL